jgi:hypothetical protein
MENIILTKEQNGIISQLLVIDDENIFKCMDLLNYFIENFPEAPGSSHNHQSYNGGYYKHINDILKYSKKMYKQLSKFGKLEFSLSDAILILFLHDIEKPIKYGLDTKESDYEIRERLMSEFNIILTDEHKNALKYIHGEGQDYSKDKRVMSPLCAFCHCCDVISARIFYK